MTHICHTKIKIMNYNIWFDDNKIIERMISLTKNIDIYMPDIVCLQEVRNDKYDFLIDKLGIKYGHHYPKHIKNRYGCVIFSRYPIEKSKVIHMRSNMGREIVMAKILDMVIMNTHFESEFKQYNLLKLEQYKTVSLIMNHVTQLYGNTILCADTNVLESEEIIFNKCFEKMKDTWNEDGQCILKKYTYDSITNKNLQNRDIVYRSRIDRMLFKTKGFMKLNKFDLITGISDYIQPSDHHGIICEFDLLNIEKK